VEALAKRQQAALEQAGLAEPASPA
jgi:hypothetical protein